MNFASKKEYISISKCKKFENNFFLAFNWVSSWNFQRWLQALTIHLMTMFDQLDPVPDAQIFDLCFLTLPMLASICNHSETSRISCIWKPNSVFCFFSSPPSSTRINFEISIDFEFKLSLKSHTFSWTEWPSRRLFDRRLQSGPNRQAFSDIGGLWIIGPMISCHWFDIDLPWKVFQEVGYDYLRHLGLEFSTDRTFHSRHWNLSYKLNSNYWNLKN